MLARISAALSDLLFPAKCRACGRLYRPPERGASGSGNGVRFERVMGPFLCPACREGFLRTSSPLCTVCGEVFRSRQGEDHLCGPCMDAPRKFGRARAVGVYEKGLMEAVHSLKYRGRTELARPLGILLLAGFRHHWQPGEIDLVLPVPLHSGRMRTRGFNQSLLLIQGWTKHLMAGTCETGTTIASDLLERPKPTPSQTGLGRSKRMKNLRGAFAVRTPEKVKDRRILLVDDVYTTGATADACTEALLKAGAAQVDVLTLARTMGR